MISLSRSQSLALAAVLRECADKLDIVGYILVNRIISQEGLAPVEEIARLDKVKRDCQLISQHISELYSELEQEHSFTSLQKVIKNEEQKAMEREKRNMQKDGGERRLRLMEEFEQKVDKIKVFRQHNEDLEIQIKKISLEINEKKEFAEMLAKCAELQLQEAKIESSETEKKLEEQLESLQQQIQQEMSSHEESETFLQQQNKELQQLLLVWNERSKQMLKEKEKELHNVQCNRTINADRLMEKRRKFTEMEQVVLEDREKMKKLQKHQEEVKAATKLQAWWRGCMVRHGISSHGKPEGDKKGKKKKTGGKGKKKK